MPTASAEAPPIRLLEAGDPPALFARLPDAARIALPTSGTSGASRLIVRSVASWRASFDALTVRTGLTARSLLWLPGPVTATMNLYAAVHATFLGARLVSVLEEATHVHLTPFRLHRLLEGSAALHGRMVVVAGDGLDPALRRRAEDAGAVIQHYYGAAELSFVAWGTDSADLRPLDQVEVESRAGQLWVRSPYLADGYLGGGGRLRRDERGFATVGDRGSIEVDGRLTVAGRDGAIVTGGATVLVADVEAALRPMIRGAFAVVGLPHAELGEVVVAVVTDRDARERCAGLDLGIGRPRKWIVRSELPVTSAGKLDRRLLQEQLSDGNRS